MPSLPSEALYSGIDIYCDAIIPGLRAVQKVVETDTVLAFHHTRPYWPVHIVVVPKAHITSFLALQRPEHQAIVMQMIEVVQQVAQQVVDQNGSAAITTNLGEYQDSKHLHWHIHFGEPLQRS